MTQMTVGLKDIHQGVQGDDVALGVTIATPTTAAASSTPPDSSSVTTTTTLPINLGSMLSSSTTTTTSTTSSSCAAAFVSTHPMSSPESPSVPTPVVAMPSFADDWSPTNVMAWLRSKDVAEEYCVKLCDQEVDGSFLLTAVDDAFLESIGISKVAVRKVRFASHLHIGLCISHYRMVATVLSLVNRSLVLLCQRERERERERKSDRKTGQYTSCFMLTSSLSFALPLLFYAAPSGLSNAPAN
jgi:hypothetical protein